MGIAMTHAHLYRLNWHSASWITTIWKLSTLDRSSSHHIKTSVHFILASVDIQWATLVTNHFLRPHIFSLKSWNRTFSMIIHLLTFYLFDDIEKNNTGITHVNHSATPRAILTKVHDCTCNLNVYIFYLRFALGIIHGDRCDRKTPKTIILFK